jgi:hypothetical protein
MTLKHLFNSKLNAVYDHIARQQEANGQFRDPQEGYTIYGQYAGYYFAWLYSLDHADNPYFHHPKTLQHAIAGWDYYADIVLESGQVPVITKDRYWHDTIDEWGFYYWLQTIELIGADLDPQKRERWISLLHRIGKALVEYVEKMAVEEHFVDNLKTHSVANHHVWFVLAMYRYGIFRNDDAIRNGAREIMERILAAQLSCGTWLEGGTAVVGYGEVTSCAISLFELLDKNDSARQALERNFHYVRNTTFPGLLKNDCIDGRTWFSPKIFGYTAPSFYQFEKGRAYLTAWIKRQAAPDTDNRGLERTLQGLAVMTDIAAALPEGVETDDTSCVFAESTFTDWPELQARIWRNDDWTITGCCLKPIVGANRWIMQRQNLISVFHSQSGLIIGGGHSMAQPDFSCFNVIAAGKVSYLHDEGTILEDGLRLRYDSVNCEIRTEFCGTNQLQLHYSAFDLGENDKALAQLPLWIAGLNEIQIAGISHVLANSNSFAIDLPAGEILTLGKINIKLSEDARLLYPLDGYSPYIREQPENSKDRRQAVLQVKLYSWQNKLDVEVSV